MSNESDKQQNIQASGILGFPPSASELPSAATWEETLKLEVQDADGKSFTFNSLLQPDEEADTVLVVFIRHFFCGLCQDFIRSLQPQVTPESLLDYRTKLVIIGCGSPNLIQKYHEITATAFPIYANPSASLYNTLGMVKSLAQGKEKPDYVQTGTVSMFFSALNHGVKSVMSGGKLWDAGDIRQIGGEFIVRNGKLAWCHRMQHTVDHTGQDDLMAMIKGKEADQSIKSDAAATTHASTTTNLA